LVDPVLSSEKLMQTLQHYPVPGHYRVAFSGGLDSHVLLQLLSEIRDQIQPGFSAVHINHGLHEKADHWQAHCERTCADLEVELVTRKVNARDYDGESPEAWARQLRYQQLESLMNQDDVLLTAHHRDDQAETVLLQLFRGGGPAGLSAMPAYKAFGPGWHCRPLLEFTRNEIRQYAISAQLKWIEDESNQDLNPDRNFIRHKVLPVIQERWPSVTKTLSRVAIHQSSANHLLGVLATLDYESVRCEDTRAVRMDPLQSLGDDRIINCLRYWFELNKVPVPGSLHMQHILNDVVHGREDNLACVNWGNTEVRKYQGKLVVMQVLPEHEPGQKIRWKIMQPLKLPGGSLVATQTTGQGLRRDKIVSDQLEVRFRQGGEKIKPSGRKHTRDLKKLFQDTAIEPWLRDRIPLIYLDDQLVAIPGVCVAEGFAASANEAGLEIIWQSESDSRKKPDANGP